VKQLAFADVIILNKTDLIPAAELAPLEARIRAINAVAKIHRAQNANVPLDHVLNVGGFNLGRAIDVDPKFLEPEYPFEWAGAYALPVGAHELIIGHGVLGRLLARLTVAAGLPPPTVWELDATRSEGASGYEVIRPEADKRRDYRAVYDVSGDVRIIDKAMPHLTKGGEIVLAGFYAEPVAFNFAPAFMREAHIRAAAEWQRADMLAVRQLAEEGRLDLSGLITHRERAEHAAGAYRTAFSDMHCLKMVLDWKGCQ
jgi:hypothetical protein